MVYPGPDPLQHPGQTLLVNQAQQLLALAETNKMLTAMLAAAGQGGRGGGPAEPLDPESERLRNFSVDRYAAEIYLPGKNHSPKSATAEVARDTLKKLAACFGRSLRMGEATEAAVARFRNYLSAECLADHLAPPTANKFLRQLRAILNYAIARRVIRALSPIDFLPEAAPDVLAWDAAQLAAIEQQARKLTGTVGAVPADVFWSAWFLVFRSLGSRVTATMLCRRADYDPISRSLLLRAENQKQNRDQRIALPNRAAVAVERLLAAHEQPEIFGCWPFDPPARATGRRKWKVLSKHFEDILVKPAGLTLQKGVKTRQLRRTAATICEENGGNAQELLGHSSPKTTERYLQKSRRKICRQSLYIPDADAQGRLF